MPRLLPTLALLVVAVLAVAVCWWVGRRRARAAAALREAGRAEGRRLRAGDADPEVHEALVERRQDRQRDRHAWERAFDGDDPAGPADPARRRRDGR
ncbi:hypothetical protein [Cellulomonas endophytica]|uniref:hypothetical protein n=1 Tax=Cellulomonas endophytica TaxID=2494735 RepID=UPI001010220C|nr:hypothetical protein [Cellulomonas endophytica]